MRLTWAEYVTLVSAFTTAVFTLIAYLLFLAARDARRAR